MLKNAPIFLKTIVYIRDRKYLEDPRPDFSFLPRTQNSRPGPPGWVLDPDHAPRGERLARRAIQLALRRETLRRYAQDHTCAIEDCTNIVADSRAALDSGDPLLIPRERVFIPTNTHVAARIRLDAPPPE